MPRRREPATASVADIEAFTTGADDDVHTLDPNAKRDYTSLRLSLNQYESEMLAAAAKESGRSKVAYLRWALKKCAKEDHQGST